jgi:hypothetical protein
MKARAFSMGFWAMNAGNPARGHAKPVGGPNSKQGGLFPGMLCRDETSGNTDDFPDCRVLSRRLCTC